MVRKNTKVTTPYVALTAAEINNVITATSGTIKDKEVDPRKMIGAIHVKKYLAEVKINGKVETWINILKKLLADEKADLTSEEVQELENCKKETKEYLITNGSDSLKNRVSESTNELENLRDITTSMKYKFSKLAYEIIAHVINLMVREILVFTCESCSSKNAKQTKKVHIPWDTLKNQLMAGFYMNTNTVHNLLHAPAEEDYDQPSKENTEETIVETAEESPVEKEEELSSQEDNKPTKRRLSQYISNTFKEIKSRDARLSHLLLSKKIVELLNDIIYDLLDRYANVIKSLLQAANSKTVNERLAALATKILMEDYVHSNTQDTQVVIDLIYSRLDELRQGEEKQTVQEKQTK